MSNEITFTREALRQEILSIIPDAMISDRRAKELFGDAYIKIKKDGKVKDHVPHGRPVGRKTAYSLKEIMKQILIIKYPNYDKQN